MASHDPPAAATGVTTVHGESDPPDHEPLPGVLLLIPAALSALILAAHFLRRGQPLPVLSSFVLIALLFTRRPWAARVLQVAMCLGALEWLRTLASLVYGRRVTGEPWVRLAVILGSVAVVALLGALAFEHPRLRRRFNRVNDGMKIKGPPPRAAPDRGASPG